MEETGAITGYIDVAQLVLYAFWLFFAGLIWYLLRENKREGYPLESDRRGRVKVVGWPAPPPSKTYRMANGHAVTVPRKEGPPPLNAEPVGPWPGAPLAPTGEPLQSRLGPAAYPERDEICDVTIDGVPKIVPLRIAQGFSLAEGDPDPRGMPVLGADGEVGGTLTDLWVDRSDPLVRYYEITVPSAAGDRITLMPHNFGHINMGESVVKVSALNGAQFALAPSPASREQVTFREEDACGAFFAGGLLFASPDRSEPIL
jgi:photosynthetic reaction center H subunit